MDFPSGETVEQMAMFDIERAEEMWRDAKEWVRKNHAAWLWMCGEAMRLSTEKKHFSIDQFANVARYGMPINGVNEFKFDNDIRAPLARMLKEAVPQCEDYLETRWSVCDLVRG